MGTLAGAAAYGGAIAAVAGAATGAVSASTSAAAQKNAATYQSEVAAQNQRTAALNAEHATQAGQAQAEAESMKQRQVLGQAIASEAANGVDVNSGSAVDTQKSVREEGQLDTMNVVGNAANVAYGYEAQASGYGAQSQLDTMTASDASAAGEIGATSSLIGGASSLASQYAQNTRNGIPGWGGVTSS